MNLDGFVKQPRHISEQCALIYVSRGVVVSIEVLTLTIDSRCVDENSDFLSMESLKLLNRQKWPITPARDRLITYFQPPLRLTYVHTTGKDRQCQMCMCSVLQPFQRAT